MFTADNLPEAARSRIIPEKSAEAGFEDFREDDLAAMRAAFAKANEQAEAREIEAVREIANERSLHAGTKSRAEHAERERDEARQELSALRAHADKLEALLTVDGVDGEKVKLWLPFEQRCHLTEMAPYFRDSWGPGNINFSGGIAYDYRQSPAPAAEPLKRWKIANADEFTDDVEYFVSRPMTRTDAERRGKVIGEAGE